MSNNICLIKYNPLDGKIAFDSLDTSTQSEFLESLLFIEYGARYCIDVEWNPKILPEPCFVIRVIEDGDWDAPLLEKKIKSENALNQAIQEAIDFTVKFIQENPNRPLREETCCYNED